MSARYLVRLDDATPEMNRAKWARMEAILDRLAVRPIVAVVPDNRDPGLVYDTRDPEFWDTVRRWQDKGWSIGLHGLHHVYHAIDRKKLIVPFKDASEFAGLDFDRQRSMLAKGWAIFVRERISSKVFIAPGHSFDQVTLDALKAATPIRVISDGLSLAPFESDGLTWVPQQIWRPSWRPGGVWTICLHPNTMEEADWGKLERGLKRLGRKFIALPDVTGTKRTKDIWDRIFPLTHSIEQIVMRRLLGPLLAFRHIIRNA